MQTLRFGSFETRGSSFQIVLSANSNSQTPRPQSRRQHQIDSVPFVIALFVHFHLRAAPDATLWRQNDLRGRGESRSDSFCLKERVIHSFICKSMHQIKQKTSTHYEFQYSRCTEMNEMRWREARSGVASGLSNKNSFYFCR